MVMEMEIWNMVMETNVAKKWNCEEISAVRVMSLQRYSLKNQKKFFLLFIFIFIFKFKL